ncbi:alpha-1,6-mannosyl-glycoprotein 2-beta-N-acetylglucosaminyltransferase-like [Ostrinia nubilalis]|uniref:alpha-1,6-mannosyl-glycoprotein 2-beta-N-acetylglucosaminyltransferase-like n=1 Tax=Ostrinia nubilalis TaxID=29057 RepID=UPI003082534F
MNMQDAEAVNCTGALYPDIHGLYRNPSQSETKHQWWWTANTIFDKLSCTKNHTGTFVFLNNDIYLLQDFIYMIVYMNQLGEFLPHHDFLSLDAVLDLNKIDAYRADIEKWVPTNNPDVLAFSAATWNSIVYHYDLFCRIDDYSWAKSLYYISLNRKDKKEPFKVMSTALARAFKTSNCGFEAKLVDCDVIETVFQVSNLQKNIKDDLFPSYLDVYTKLELHDEFESIEYADLNGGWNDPRDKEMCNNMLNREKKTTPSDTKITNYNSDYRDFSI